MTNWKDYQPDKVFVAVLVIGFLIMVYRFIKDFIKDK